MYLYHLQKCRKLQSNMDHWIVARLAITFEIVHLYLVSHFIIVILLILGIVYYLISMLFFRNILFTGCQSVFTKVGIMIVPGSKALAANVEKTTCFAYDHLTIKMKNIFFSGEKTK